MCTLTGVRFRHDLAVEYGDPPKQQIMQIDELMTLAIRKKITETNNRLQTHIIKPLAVACAADSAIRVIQALAFHQASMDIAADDQENVQNLRDEVIRIMKATPRLLDKMLEFTVVPHPKIVLFRCILTMIRDLKWPLKILANKKPIKKQAT
jgi:hypothetical protein